MDAFMFGALLHTMITAGTPIVYAALGEIITERVGILNLGLEGVMLIGSVAGFATASQFSNHWLGLLASMIAGALVGLFFALLCVGFKVDQVVAGIALSTFGIGFSAFIGKPWLGKPLTVPFEDIRLPLLGDIPFIGDIFFNQDALVYISYLLVPVLWYFIYRTRPGLHLRSVGENPRAADTMGINVTRMRYVYTAIGCSIAAIGGAYLTMAFVPTWFEEITVGRGWIAVSLVIFAGWNPLIAIGGAYLFGGVDAATLFVQAAGTNVPSHFLGMAPYILTILVLLFAARRRKGGLGPAALSVPYDSEER
jgi:general nucleoside transport system permease protein